MRNVFTYFISSLYFLLSRIENEQGHKTTYLDSVNGMAYVATICSPSWNDDEGGRDGMNAMISTFDLWTVEHELGHTLGFYHDDVEQFGDQCTCLRGSNCMMKGG